MERYVSKEGNDTGEGSRTDPWMTLGAASSRLEAGNRLVIAPGEYREQLVLGKPGVKITGDGNAVISGWRKLPPIGDKPWEMRDNLWTLPIPFGSKYGGVRRVRINGREVYGNAQTMVWSYQDRVLRVVGPMPRGTAIDAVCQYFDYDISLAIIESPGCKFEGLIVDGGTILTEIKNSNFCQFVGCTWLHQGWAGLRSDSDGAAFRQCTFDSRHVHPWPTPLVKDYEMELLSDMLRFHGNKNTVRNCMFAGLHHGGIQIEGKHNLVIDCCFVGAGATYARPFSVGGSGAEDNMLRDCVVVNYNVQPQLHGLRTRVIGCTFAHAYQTPHVQRPVAWGNNSESYGTEWARRMLFRNCTFADLEAGALRFEGKPDRPLTAVVKGCRYLRCGDEPVVIGPHAQVQQLR